MEKNVAHYPLDEVKARVLEHGLNAFTQTASNNARLMGLDRMAAVAVVLGLQRGMLFKSMTRTPTTGCGRTCTTRLARMEKRLTSR